MGLCIDDHGLTLTCDGDHRPGTATIAIFEHSEGFIAAYRMAMVAGWKDTHSPSPGSHRVFFGPCCSGKHSTPPG